MFHTTPTKTNKRLQSLRKLPSQQTPSNPSPPTNNTTSINTTIIDDNKTTTFIIKSIQDLQLTLDPTITDTEQQVKQLIKLKTYINTITNIIKASGKAALLDPYYAPSTFEEKGIYNAIIDQIKLKISHTLYMHINTNELTRIDTILRAIQTIASDEEKKFKKMIQSSISTFIPTEKETVITATQRLLLLCQSNELLKCGTSEDLIRDKFLLIIGDKDPQRIYTTKVISEAIETKISSNLEAHLSKQFEYYPLNRHSTHLNHLPSPPPPIQIPHHQQIPRHSIITRIEATEVEAPEAQAEEAETEAAVAMSDHIPHTATEDLDEDEEEAVVAGESATDPGETARLDINLETPMTRAKQLLKKPR